MNKQLIPVFFLLFFLQTAVLQGQPDSKKIDEYLATARREWKVPGMAVAIVKDGKVALATGYGVKESGGDERVDKNTLFAIASNTKAFTASALAVLVAEGKIRWEDKVVDYLPEFELYDPYATKEATIRDLLCHRVGLGTFSGDLMWYKSTLTSTELVGKIKYIPQAYGFRDGYGYSNMMFIAAGEVIRKVTGKSWDEFVSERFLEPLKMDRTITSIRQLESRGNYARPHKPFEEGNLVLDWENWDNMGAAGGIISSVKDMANWMIMNLHQGVFDGDTLLPGDQQNILWTPHNNFILTENNKKQLPGRHFTGYGLGWALSDYYGRMVVSHSGGYDGMYSRVMLLPDENLGIVILTNSMAGITLPLCYYIINQYINEDLRDWSTDYLVRSGEGRLLVPDPIIEKRKKATHPIARYTGVYESGMHGEVIISLEKNQLRLQFKNAPALEATLIHSHQDTWNIEWKEVHAWFDEGTAEFLLDSASEVTGLHFDVPNYDIFFDEVDLIKIID